MWDPNHEPKHRADRDTDSLSLARYPAPWHVSGVVVGRHRRSFLGDAHAAHLADLAASSTSAMWVQRCRARTETGSASMGALLILFAFGLFLVGVGAMARLVIGAQP